MAILMLKIRRPNGRLIFNMGIPIPGKDGLYIETGPRPLPELLLTQFTDTYDVLARDTELTITHLTKLNIKNCVVLRFDYLMTMQFNGSGHILHDFPPI